MRRPLSQITASSLGLLALWPGLDFLIRAAQSTTCFIPHICVRFLLG